MYPKHNVFIETAIVDGVKLSQVKRQYAREALITQFYRITKTKTWRNVFSIEHIQIFFVCIDKLIKRRRIIWRKRCRILS